MKKYRSLFLAALYLVFLLGGCETTGSQDKKLKIPDGIRSLYLMDNTSGDVLTDSSGNQLHGSVKGTKWTPGLINGSLEFDGGTSYAQLPESAGAAKDFTFAAWIYWKGGGIDQRILDFSNGKKKYMYLTPRGGLPGNSQDYIRFAICNGREEQFLTTENPLPSNRWVHVAVTLEGDVGRLYVDGQLKDSNPNMTINPMDIGFKDLYFGCSRTADAQFFKGRMDQVLLADRALSQEELMDLANPLLAAYSMDKKDEGLVLKGATYIDAGFLGKGLSFAKKGAYAELPLSVAGGEDFTFAAWTCWEGGEEEQYILYLLGDSGHCLFLSPNREGVLSLTAVTADGTKSVSAAKPLATGRWVHLTVVMHKGNAALYVDGVPAAEAKLGLYPRDLQVTQACLGRNPQKNGEEFKGKLDEISFYYNALTPEMVAGLARAPRAQYALNGSMDSSAFPIAVTEGKAQYRQGYAPGVQALSLSGNQTVKLDPRLADSANMSFVAWFNRQGGQEDQTLVSFGRDEKNRLELICNGQGNLRLEISMNGETKVLNGTGSLPEGQWIQAAFTLKDGTGRLYIDGDLQGELEGLPRPQELSCDKACLEGSVSGGCHFSGLIQSVSFFGAGLSREDICSLQRQVINFPSQDLNLEYVKGGDPTIAENYKYWKYAQEHDGEIVKDGDTYYMYSTDCSPGNHTQPTAPLRPAIQIRRSTDLIHWEFVGWVWDSVPREAADWTRTTNMLWAPSVGKIGDTWYLYYSVSSLGNRQTYLGVATSNSPAGPWTDRGEVFKVSNNDPKYNVNPIDPHLLIDKDGRPWLSYGAYYGGIYINEIDPKTGKFLEYGEGTCIARRTDRIATDEQDSIEGAFIVYHEESDKYVLFVSYDHYYGHYNLRVGRSDRPDGVYLDYNGNSLTDTSLQKQLQVGFKVMGSYRFQGHPGWIGLGHNAIYKEDGRWFCLNNSHFVNDASYCYMQLRTMLWTEDGWPVVSPQRYAGETIQKIPAKALVGDWEVVQFELQNKEMKTASRLRLDLDGTLDGNSHTKWSFEGDNKLILRYYDKNVKGGYRIYTTFVLPGWDWENWKPCLVFTGKDQFGETIWGKSV